MKKIQNISYIITLLMLAFVFKSNAQCLQANAVAICTGSNNMMQYYVEVDGIIGTDANNSYTVSDGSNVQNYSGNTLTFGPYNHSGTGLTTKTFTINNTDGLCSTTVEALETLCGPAITCDCNNINPLSILASSQPGTFNFTTHTNIYLLADDMGNFIAYNNSGYFNGLEANLLYNIVAVNVDNTDLTDFISNIITSNMVDVLYNIAPFSDYCYESTSQPYLINQDCGCFSCPTLSNLIAPTTVCNGSPFDLSVATTQLSGQNLNIQFVYNGAPFGTANPYLSGNILGTASVEFGIANLSGAVLPQGSYEISAILSPIPTDPNCRPFESTTILVTQAPIVTATAICSGSTALDQYYIEVSNVVGADPTNIYNVAINGNSQIFNGNVLTFGPFFHSGSGLGFEIVSVSNASNAACVTDMEVLETYCGPSYSCDCSNNLNPLNILASMQPGTFNSNGFTNVYILTDDIGNILNHNNTGYFEYLSDNVTHQIYASNVSNLDLAAFESSLAFNTIPNVLNFAGAFVPFCYDIIPIPATFLQDCDCGNLDLAITKSLAPSQPNFGNVGDTISFQLAVLNNGTIDAFNITVEDIIPFGLIFETTINTTAFTGNSNDWSNSFNGASTILDSLPIGNSASLFINLIIDNAFSGFSINNNAIISSIFLSDSLGGFNLGNDALISNNTDNQNIYAYGCNNIPNTLVTNDVSQQVCTGEMVTYSSNFVPPNNNFTYLWLAIDDLGNLANYVGGFGVNYAGTFDTDVFGIGNYCIYGFSYFGGFTEFENYVNDNSINTLFQLNNDIANGFICASLSNNSNCVELNIFETPIADITSSAILCNIDSSDYPTSINLNDLIISPANIGIANWYYDNLGDSLFTNTVIDANDPNLPETLYYIAFNGNCNSISYTLNIDVLDCAIPTCSYSGTVLNTMCNADGTYDLSLLVEYAFTLSDQFYVNIAGVDYGPFLQDVSPDVILLSNLTTDGSNSEIIISDSLSNTLIAPKTIFISEIHYDNFGGDINEALEVTAIAGTDLSNYQIWLYNGSTGNNYGSFNLNGIAADQSNGYGTAVINLPANGFQNAMSNFNGTISGSGDGLALIDNSDPLNPIVIEFISYEGIITALDGPANGMSSIDILVEEPGESFESLQLTDIGWLGPIQNTFGAINNSLTLDTTSQVVVCESIIPFVLPNCTPCGFNPTFITSNCNANNSVFFTIATNSISTNAGTYNISLVTLNGLIPLGNFMNANDATIGPFLANGIQTYTFLISDSSLPTCNSTLIITPLDCNFINNNPAISIDKNDADNLDDFQNLLVGQNAEFTITVTNIGDEPLTNVTVSDSLGLTCEATYLQNGGILNPNESWTYTCSVSGYTNSLVNTAVVNANGISSNLLVSDQDGSTVNVEDPNCTSGIILNNFETLVCAGESAQASFQGASTQQTFVLHNGNNGAIGFVYDYNNIGVFENDGTYPYNSPLCITAIVSAVSDPNTNFPIQNAICYDISDCLPVIFLAPISVNTVPICDTDGLTYSVELFANGGAPSFDDTNYTYNFNNTYFGNPSQILTITNFTANTAYQIAITDNNNCEANFNFPTVFCTPDEPLDTFTCNFVAGLLPTSSTFICNGDFAAVNMVGSFIDNPNAIINYILRDANNSLLTYEINDSGVFENLGNYPVDLEICAAIGFPIGNSNLIDFSNNCTTYSTNCATVKFLEPISVNTNEQCLGASLFVVNFNISGGAASALDSASFITSGAYNGTVYENNTYFAGPFTSNYPYYINVIDGKGCATTFTSDTIICGVLPVELISFNGSINANGNMLKWIIGSELNNDFYTLERSLNGSNFEKVADVISLNPSSESKNYQFLDEIMEKGEYVYRLSQTDFDGNLSEIGFVNLIRNEIIDFTYNIFPNPVIESLTIKLETNEAELVNITLFNLDGKIIYSKQTAVNAGITNENIDFKEFSAGIYHLQIDYKNEIITKQVVKL